MIKSLYVKNHLILRPSFFYSGRCPLQTEVSHSERRFHISIRFFRPLYLMGLGYSLLLSFLLFQTFQLFLFVIGLASTKMSHLSTLETLVPQQDSFSWHELEMYTCGRLFLQISFFVLTESALTSSNFLPEDKLSCFIILCSKASPALIVVSILRSFESISLCNFKSDVWTRFVSLVAVSGS